MLVLVPDDLRVDHLGALPSELRLREITAETGPRDDLAAAEVLVLDPRYRDWLVQTIPVLPALRYVQALNAGVDWVPQLPPNATLCKAAGVHDGPVAEWIVAVVLAMQKRLPWFLAEQREQRWDAAANLAFGDGPAAEDLSASTVLIIGHGSIGRAVATRLRGFGTRVIAVTRRGQDGNHTPDEVPALLGAADVVVLLAPATAETAGLVDAAFLDRMRPGALLVNASRGSLIVTADVMDALRAGRVRAALDATDPEPLPPGHPLWDCPNLLITPHVAGSSAWWRERAAAFVGDQLRRYAAGEQLEAIVDRAPAVR